MRGFIGEEETGLQFECLDCNRAASSSNLIPEPTADPAGLAELPAGNRKWGFVLPSVDCIESPGEHRAMGATLGPACSAAFGTHLST